MEAPELAPEGAWGRGGLTRVFPVHRSYLSAPGFGKGLVQQSYFYRCVGFGQGVLKAAVKRPLWDHLFSQVLES